MIVELSIAMLIAVHTAVSIVGLAAGAQVVWAMVRGREPAGVGLFLAATLAASATAFLFPSKQFGLGHAAGLLSLAVLAPTIYAYAAGQVAGIWRTVFAAGATAALYLNTVVAVLVLFKKVPALRPDGLLLTAPSFLATQFVLLLAFIPLGVLAVQRYREKSPDRSSIGSPWGVRAAARSHALR